MRNNSRHRNNEDMAIVYEDQWLIVVDKPHGLLTMSTGRKGEETAYTMLTDYPGFSSLPRISTPRRRCSQIGKRLCRKGITPPYLKGILTTMKDG